LYPPNHWGCRARVRTLNDRQLGQYDFKVDSSEGRLITRNFTIGKDDAKRTVPVTGFKLADNSVYWPDPGWDYNPGTKGFDVDLKKYDNDIAELMENRK
jgi:uncharacterized protein with gpF-like domain